MRHFIFTACVLVSLPLPALAESTRFHSYEGFANFLDGDAKGTALTANGQIELGPPIKKVFEEKEGRIAASAAYDGKVALAFVPNGRLVVVDQDGKKTEWGEAQKGVVTAMALTSSGLYVATMGPTQLVKYPKAGSKAEPLTLPVPEKSKAPAAIWAIAESKKGLLIAASGPGSLYRQEGGKFVEVFKSNEDGLRSLAVDDAGMIFVGGGSKGIIYRGSSDKGGFVAIHDSGLDEVTGLLPTKDGEVYFLGLSGATARDGRGERIAEKGKIRSTFARIDKDGFVDVLAGSDDEILYALSPAPEGKIYVATGSVDKENLRGRLYTTHPKTREIALVYQTAAAQAIALLASKKGLALVTNDPPAVEQLESGYVKEGEFTLPIFDAQTQSRFGSVQLDASPSQKGVEVIVRLRTGQVQTPDATWSSWTRDLPVGIGASELPAGRFVQAKVVMKSDGKATPQARRLRIAYGRNNLAPYVGEIALLPKNVMLASLPGDTTRERTISVNDKGLQELRRISAEPPGDASAKARQSFVDGMLSVAWVAQDPNGDDMLFDLFVRAEGEQQWKKLKSGLDVPFHSFAGLSLPDGRYQFRVNATDSPSNGPQDAKSETKESAWFTIDNSPPAVSKIEVAKRKTLSFAAKDLHSVLIRAEYAVDGSPLRPLSSKDGLVDSKEEAFEVQLPELSNDPHVITVRLQDEAGNVASGEARF
ncbi:MAG: hypothetical protein IT381_12790 [Deltaproteobacteria bacterium]|nr:hypothetical protein [Deltaproteobacteria bacterium]